jgi:hypothetical protein
MMSTLEKRRRFDDWPPEIPRVNTVVQLQFWGGDVIEGSVLSRDIIEGRILSRAKHTKDSMDTYNAYKIIVQTTLGYNLSLDITPGIDGSGVNNLGDRRPWWQTIPEKRTESRHDVKLFFLD